VKDLCLLLLFITTGPSNDDPSFIVLTGVCLLLQDLVQSCFTWGGGGDMGGHVLRETTSRGATRDYEPAHHALVNAGEREIV
jgi:hypothetical protein